MTHSKTYLKNALIEVGHDPRKTMGFFPRENGILVDLVTTSGKQTIKIQYPNGISYKTLTENDYSGWLVECLK